MLSVFPKKHLCIIILFVSLALTACGGGGGGGNNFTVTKDNNVDEKPPVKTFTPDRSVSEFDASSLEYIRTPSLSSFGLSPFFTLGLSGAGVTIGILDSGIDADHEELDGRVTGGGDWQGDSQGLADPFGHGTHVASIVAAARNQRGIHGVAPLSHLVSYRILNDNGKFGTQSGNIMVPAILGDALSKKLPVINNSWASIYEINDISKPTLDRILRPELESYFQLAHTQGPVMVWAAGNDSDDQVSIRSGLPYHYPDLRQNWLAVVAVDNDLHEPRYTNRCGVSQSWCITAPGGGDNQYSNGILAAIPDDRYSRKSGTSMAAPFISGALALLLERFPGMTPRQAAARLLATANYEGLVTADGCTIALCTEKEMANVFGQGLINLPNALDPIGSTSVETSPYVRIPLTRSVLVTPTILGGSVQNAMAEKTIIVRDGFDNAPFALSLDTQIMSSSLRYRTKYNMIKAIGADSLNQSGFRYAEAGSAPFSPNLLATLTDPGQVSTQFSDGAWIGYELIKGNVSQQILLSHGRERAVVHGVMSHSHQGNQKWVGVGFDYHKGWLGGYAEGAFGTASSSHWGFAGITQRYHHITLAAEALLGETRLNPNALSLMTSGKYQFDAIQLAATYSYSSAIQIHLDLMLPPAVRSGQINFHLPEYVDLGSGKTYFRNHQADLGLSHRERRIDLIFNHILSEDTNFYGGLGYRLNDGHVKGQSSELVMLGIRKTF